MNRLREPEHALTHEVAYAGLVLERRRAVHARIVEAIERIHAERLEEHIEALAHHTLRAEQWEPATRLLRQAGERAQARCANREAASLYEQALVALSHLPEGQDRARQALEIRTWLRRAWVQLADSGSSSLTSRPWKLTRLPLATSGGAR